MRKQPEFLGKYGRVAKGLAFLSVNLGRLGLDETIGHDKSLERLVVENVEILEQQ